MPSQSSPSPSPAPSSAHGSMGVSSMRLPLAGGGGGEADGGGGGGATLALQTPLLQKGSAVEHTWRRGSPRVSICMGGGAHARAAGAPMAGPGAHVAAVAAVVDVSDQVGLAAGAGRVGAVQRAGQRLQPGRRRARRVAVAAEAGVVGLADAVQVARLCARAAPARSDGSSRALPLAGLCGLMMCAPW
jgi:hypothetical protein